MASRLKELLEEKNRKEAAQREQAIKNAQNERERYVSALNSVAFEIQQHLHHYLPEKHYFYLFDYVAPNSVLPELLLFLDNRAPINGAGRRQHYYHHIHDPDFQTIPHLRITEGGGDRLKFITFKPTPWAFQQHIVVPSLNTLPYVDISYETIDPFICAHIIEISPSEPEA